MRSTARNPSITVSGVTGTVPPDDQHGQQHPPVENPATQWHPQGATYLNPIAAPIAPHQLRRPWPPWVVALVGLASIGLLGVFAFVGAALKDQPTPAGIGSPAPYDALPGQQAPISTGPKDSFGAKACTAVRAVNDGPSPFSQEPAAMAAIAVDGMNSSNPFIAASAVELRDAARAAVDAKGTDPMSGLKMGTAALNLETTCIEQRYYPPAR